MSFSYRNNSREEERGHERVIIRKSEAEVDRMKRERKRERRRGRKRDMLQGRTVNEEREN